LVEVSAAEQLAALEATLPQAAGADAEWLVGLACQLAGEIDTENGAGQLRRLWAQVSLGPDVAMIKREASRLIVQWGWKGEEALWPALAEVSARAWREDERVRREPASIEGILRLAEMSGEGAVAATVAELVIGGETTVASRAARVLKEMAAKRGANVEGGREVRNALAMVCERFDEHRIGAVLVAAAQTLTAEVRGTSARQGECEPLVRWFREMTRSPHPALLAMLRSKGDAIVKQRCWEWMRCGKLAEACGEGWKKSEGGAWHGTGPSALAAHGTRRNAVRLHEAHVVAMLNEGGERSWVGALLADQGDERVMACLLQSEEPRVRMRLASEVGERFLLDVALLLQGGMAGLAVERLSAIGLEADAWRMLGRGADEGVRRAAREELARRGVCRDERGMLEYPVDVLRVGVQMAARDSAAAMGDLAMAIERGDEEEAQMAARLCRRVGADERVIGSILTRCGRELARHEGGFRLAAILTSASVEATRGQEEAYAGVVEDLLRSGLRHTDGRVRSNAIEAISRWERRSGRTLGVERAIVVKEESSRPRGTVLREEARRAASAEAVEGVVEQTLSMLGDQRTEHRLSATWVSEKVLITLGPARAGERWGELCERLVEVADRDAAQAVRARAAAVTRRLMAEIRVHSRRGAGFGRTLESGVGR
jgi:hypothetical protein